MLRAILCLTFFYGGMALAAGGGGNYPDAPIDRSDVGSLQRGAAVFVNYCMGCHSAEYVRYGRLMEDLNIPEDILRDKIIHTDAGLGDGMLSAMRRDDATEWFHQAAPPDLSLSARLRGTNWLYAYMRSFHRDSSRPSGWNNTVFENVAMPHVLADLQGINVLADDGTHKLETLKSGKLSAVAYDLMINDLVNFMDYMADPDRPARHRAGYAILFFLFILLISAYFLYREYWNDIH